jgi:hypothetical protein
MEWGAVMADCDGQASGAGEGLGVIEEFLEAADEVAQLVAEDVETALAGAARKGIDGPALLDDGEAGADDWPRLVARRWAN